jgi:translation initiation factor IF-1
MNVGVYKMKKIRVGDVVVVKLENYHALIGVVERRIQLRHDFRKLTPTDYWVVQYSDSPYDSISLKDKEFEVIDHIDETQEPKEVGGTIKIRKGDVVVYKGNSHTLQGAIGLVDVETDPIKSYVCVIFNWQQYFIRKKNLEVIDHIDEEPDMGFLYNPKWDNQIESIKPQYGMSFGFNNIDNCKENDCINRTTGKCDGDLKNCPEFLLEDRKCNNCDHFTVCKFIFDKNQNTAIICRKYKGDK